MIAWLQAIGSGRTKKAEDPTLSSAFRLAGTWSYNRTRNNSRKELNGKPTHSFGRR